MKECPWCNQLFEMRKTGGSPQQYCCQRCRRKAHHAANQLDHSAYERYWYEQRKATDPTFLPARAAKSRAWRARYPDRVNRARPARRILLGNTLRLCYPEAMR